MKTHHRAITRNNQDRYALKRSLLCAHLQGVAEKILQERWDFWQVHHINRETIEYTLENLMVEEQNRDPFNIGWRFDWNELCAIAREAYDAQQSVRKEKEVPSGTNQEN